MKRTEANLKIRGESAKNQILALIIFKTFPEKQKKALCPL